MEMESNTLLRSCQWGLTNSSFFVLAPDFQTAWDLKNDFLVQLARQAFRFRRQDAKVYYPGCGDRPYQIPVEMSGLECPCEPEPPHQQESSMTEKLSLLGADYVRLHEFLVEQRESGNIVIVTSNITRDQNGNPISTENPQAGRDMCHHTNDLLLPKRAFWSPRQFTGYNYRLSWRRDQNDYENLNPQYHKLKEKLASDGYVPNFEYTLYRPDGALCYYSTTYFLCRDYLGDEVRIGVSRPQDWQLLEEAPN